MIWLPVCVPVIAEPNLSTAFIASFSNSKSPVFRSWVVLPYARKVRNIDETKAKANLLWAQIIRTNTVRSRVKSTTVWRVGQIINDKKRQTVLLPDGFFVSISSHLQEWQIRPQSIPKTYRTSLRDRRSMCFLTRLLGHIMKTLDSDRSSYLRCIHMYGYWMHFFLRAALEHGCSPLRICTLHAVRMVLYSRPYLT